MHPKTALVVAHLALVPLLVACGNSTDGDASDPSTSSPKSSGSLPAPASASGKSMDACTLITTGDVAKVLSDHSADHATYSVTSTTGADGSCTYAWTVNGGGDEFSVNEFPATSYVPQPGVEPRRIPGIGDEAFEEVGSFYARVGDEMVNVVNVQEGEGADEALLAIAAGRLG